MQGKTFAWLVASRARTLIEASVSELKEIILVTAPSSSMANTTSVDYLMFSLVIIIWPMKDLVPTGPLCCHRTKLASLLTAKDI